MELTSDVMIDLALNAIGYLAAGAFGVVVASIFRKRPQAVSEPETDYSEVSAETAGVAAASSRAQFVALGKTRHEVDSDPDRTVPGQPKPNVRRDRSEVLELARQMLKAGAGPDRIMQVLPVSETELGLLTYGSK